MNRIDTTRVTVLFLLLAVAGCSAEVPDDPPGYAAATLEDIVTMCDAWRGWAEGCSATPGFSYDLTWGDECEADPRWSLVREEWTSSMAGCFSTLSCGSSDDECSTQAITSLYPDPMTDPLFVGCLDKSDACPGVSDDGCLGVLAYYDEPRLRIEGCLSLGCGDFGECLEDPMAY